MLPIALKSFHIKNYRGIIDAQIDNIPPDTQWIFLTGENGFGKTSVLQGIAMVGCPLFQQQSYYYKHIEEQSEKPEISMDFICNGVPSYAVYPNFTVDDLKGNNNGQLVDITSKIIGYGSSRLRVSNNSIKEVLKNHSLLDSLLSHNTNLLDIEEELKDWYSNYKEGFDQLESIFISLIPKLSRIQVEFDIRGYRSSRVKYYESDLGDNLFDKGITFDELASVYVNIFAMIGDMIIRFSESQSVENFSDLEGIVLIDEIDLHLHPKYQKLFVQKLTELFPKIQFIVSTHSPIPLLGSPPNSVVINVSRTREEGIKTELLDIDSSVLTPNAILSSPIFGFQDLIPESKSDDKMIRTEDTYKEVLFNNQLKENINQFLTKERQEELLKLIKIKLKSLYAIDNQRLKQQA